MIGSLDTTFGTNGYNLTNPGTPSYIWSIAIQSDGKIVVGGISGQVHAVGRYNCDGSVDTTFGVNGYNLTAVSPSGSNALNFIALQPDGKIVAGGSSAFTVKSFTVIRYNSDGSLDTAFGTGGNSHFTPGTDDAIGCLAIQPDGKIVAAGTTKVGSNYGWGLIRYNSDGSLDTAFGTSGYSTTTPGTHDIVITLALQPDGKILVGGFAQVGGNYVPAIGRYNSNGSLDTAFGTSGYNFTAPTNPSYLWSFAIQPDGKIVAGGQATVGGNAAFLLIRYNSDGSLDTTFGTGGYTISNPGTADVIRNIKLQSNGKIVAGGYATVGGNQVFALARYNSNGCLDTNGYTLTTPGISDLINSVATLSNGSVIAGGYATVDGIQRFAITKYIYDAPILPMRLNGAIDSLQQNIPVLNLTLFSPERYVIFDILIDNELMTVMSTMGGSFFVVRGVKGTKAVSHRDQTIINDPDTCYNYNEPLGLRDSLGHKVLIGPNLTIDSTNTLVVSGGGSGDLSSLGSYSNPSWLTSILGSIVSGNISGSAGGLTANIPESRVTNLTADLASLNTNTPFTFGGTDIPAVANDVCPWLYVPRAAVAVRFTLSCLSAPTGNFQITIRRSSNSGSTFPDIVTTATITTGNRIVTTTTFTNSVLVAGDYLRCDVISVNGASGWTARLETTIPIQ